MEPERLAVPSGTCATAVLDRSGRKLPIIVTEVAGAVVEGVHRSDPSDRRCLVHRPILVDVGNSECFLAGQIAVGEPGDVEIQIIDGLTVGGRHQRRALWRRNVGRVVPCPACVH